MDTYLNDAFTFITVIVYGLAVLNMVRILNQNLNPSTALAWIVINFAFPWVGVPLYYLLGQNRLHSYVRRREKSHDELGRTPLGHLADSPHGIEPEAPTSSKLALFETIFGAFGNIYRATRGEVRLLIDGEEAFPAMFEAIERARSYIFVQFYIIRSDRLGHHLKDHLIAKAREGVQVYLLYDDVGSFWLRRRFIRSLKKGGVKVASFLPVSLPGALQINFRNHRKLVIVDGEVAFTGGLNVGEEYIGKRKDGYWRDTHVRVSGEPVRMLEQAFLDDWYFAARKRIKLAPLSTQVGKQRRGKTQICDSGPSAFVQVIPFGPNDHNWIGIFLFMQCIQSATKRLWITTPYFVPDMTLERLLELAALRGVDVRILIPQQADFRFVHWVSLSYAEQLARKGIRVYLYSKGFLHQKVMLIDDEMTVIGTSNFDNRAMYLNFETSLVVHCREFAERTHAMLSRDLDDATPMYPKKIKTSFGKRLRLKIARLLAPLM